MQGSSADTTPAEAAAPAAARARAGVPRGVTAAVLAFLLAAPVSAQATDTGRAREAAPQPQPAAGQPRAPAEERLWSTPRERGGYSLMDLVPGAPLPAPRATAEAENGERADPASGAEAGADAAATRGAALAGLEDPRDWRGRGSYRNHRFDYERSRVDEPDARFSRSGQYAWPTSDSRHDGQYGDDVFADGDDPYGGQGYGYPQSGSYRGYGGPARPGGAGGRYDDDWDDDWDDD